MILLEACKQLFTTLQRMKKTPLCTISNTATECMWRLCSASNSSKTPWCRSYLICLQLKILITLLIIYWKFFSSNKWNWKDPWKAKIREIQTLGQISRRCSNSNSINSNKHNKWCNKLMWAIKTLWITREWTKIPKC